MTTPSPAENQRIDASVIGTGYPVQRALTGRVRPSGKLTVQSVVVKADPEKGFGSCTVLVQDETGAVWNFGCNHFLSDVAMVRAPNHVRGVWSLVSDGRQFQVFADSLGDAIHKLRKERSWDPMPNLKFDNRISERLPHQRFSENGVLL